MKKYNLTIKSGKHGRDRLIKTSSDVGEVKKLYGAMRILSWNNRKVGRCCGFEKFNPISGEYTWDSRWYDYVGHRSYSLRLETVNVKKEAKNG